MGNGESAPDGTGRSPSRESGPRQDWRRATPWPRKRCRGSEVTHESFGDRPSRGFRASVSAERTLGLRATSAKRVRLLRDARATAANESLSRTAPAMIAGFWASLPTHRHLRRPAEPDRPPGEERISQCGDETPGSSEGAHRSFAARCRFAGTRISVRRKPGQPAGQVDRAKKT
jgi:hypothetical protein